jgi:hypothetical protein
MLPTVLIGVDATVLEAFNAWRDKGTLVLDYPDVETAQFDLVDRLQREETVTQAVTQADDGRWNCTVVYGEKSIGRAVSGQVERLDHTGWAIAAHHHIPEDAVTRRVRDGQVEGEDQSKMVWQGAIVLQVNTVVDVAVPGVLDQIAKAVTERPYL